MTADAFTWPEDPRLADLRAQLATAQAALASLAASVAEVVAYADRHDGRAPVNALRAALAEAGHGPCLCVCHDPADDRRAVHGVGPCICSGSAS